MVASRCILVRVTIFLTLLFYFCKSGKTYGDSLLANVNTSSELDRVWDVCFFSGLCSRHGISWKNYLIQVRFLNCYVTWQYFAGMIKGHIFSCLHTSWEQMDLTTTYCSKQNSQAATGSSIQGLTSFTFITELMSLELNYWMLKSRVIPFVLTRR